MSRLADLMLISARWMLEADMIVAVVLRNRKGWIAQWSGSCSTTALKFESLKFLQTQKW
jgi:hypothetical protein